MIFFDDSSSQHLHFYADFYFDILYKIQNSFVSINNCSLIAKRIEDLNIVSGMNRDFY